VFGASRCQLLVRLVVLLVRRFFLRSAYQQETAVLNDTRIRNIKPRERDFKLFDFDGLYLLVCKVPTPGDLG
jgi:hypothetical protein